VNAHQKPGIRDSDRPIDAKSQSQGVGNPVCGADITLADRRAVEQVKEEAKAESSGCRGVATWIAEVGGAAPWLDVVAEEVRSWIRIRQFEVGHDGHIDQVDEPIVVEPLP